MPEIKIIHLGENCPSCARQHRRSPLSLISETWHLEEGERFVSTQVCQKGHAYRQVDEVGFGDPRNTIQAYLDIIRGKIASAYSRT